MAGELVATDERSAFVLMSEEGATSGKGESHREVQHLTEQQRKELHDG